MNFDYYIVTAADMQQFGRTLVWLWALTIVGCNVENLINAGLWLTRKLSRLLKGARHVQ